MNPISLKFVIDKRDGYGEDSTPLSIAKNNFFAVGVFDGMGGSGAAICKSEFGDNHTKAYVASRIIYEAIRNYLENVKDVRDINSDGIKNTARGRLEQEKSNYPTKISGLRSKLVRDYPTTLAITTAIKNEDGTHAVNSYWAGDSRNYLWTTDGFYQISKDDLDTESDPLENLRNDGALSNCICADREFCINSKTIPVVGKFVILSATDGCFNYFATPMHFQEVLLTGLKLSECVEEWEKFCKEEFSAVTGDDVSISLLAIGFVNFDDLKETFIQSTITGIEEIKSAQDEIKLLTSKLESAKKSLESLIQSEWDVYKLSYMKYLSEETNYIIEDVNDTVSEEISIVSSSEGNVVITTKDTADDTDNSNSSENGKIESSLEESLSEEKGKDNTNTAEVVVCETKPKSTETEEYEKNIMFSDKAVTSKKIAEDDVIYHENKTIEEKVRTSTTINDNTQKETPRFGRIEIKSTPLNSLKTNGYKPSDVDTMIKRFKNSPSYETANLLIDMILDVGDMHNIPQEIRIELKKFKR